MWLAFIFSCIPTKELKLNLLGYLNEGHYNYAEIWEYAGDLSIDYHHRHFDWYKKDQTWNLEGLDIFNPFWFLILNALVFSCLSIFPIAILPHCLNALIIPLTYKGKYVNNGKIYYELDLPWKLQVQDVVIDDYRIKITCFKIYIFPQKENLDILDIIY